MLEDLLDEVNIMLSTLWVSYKRTPVGSGMSDIFVIQDLGVVVVGIEPIDYSHMLSKLVEQYKGYRFIFISTVDNLFTKKDEVIWDLMRSGYIRQVRTNYQRQFNNIVQQGFGRKIIAERLRVWNDNPKYRYLIEENKRCLDVPSPMLLSQDPAFFDFMPENLEEI